jgi:peptidoglycan/LPS O-acetylase OafA/YrhL
MGGLRFCLAMAVVYGHVLYFRGYLLIPGDTPVQAFYAVSGFYMALVLNEKYPPGRCGYWLFISNRYARLYPVYLAVLCLTLLVALAISRSAINLPFARDWHPPQIDVASTVFLLLTQILMVGQDLLIFLTLEDGTLAFWPDFHTSPQPLYGFMAVPQAWTLSVELSFYVIAPLIVRRSIGTMVIVLLASLAIRLTLQFGFGLFGDPWSYRFFPSELAVFMLGAIGYRLRKSSSAGFGRAFGLLVLMAICVATALLVNRWHGLTRLASVSALLLVFIAIPTLFRATKNSNLDHYLGELSYPIYVGHLLVIWLIGMITTFDSAILHLVVVTVFTLLFAIVLYAFVDRPVDQWRQKRLEAELGGHTAPLALDHRRLAS